MYNAFRNECLHLCIVVKIHSQFKEQNMNKTELKGNWNEQKGKLKQKFANLTDNDLLFDEGKKDEMLGKLQIKLGKTKEELHRIMSGHE
jgi:uncharacterized protein YjbJ (UPF0337 family)